MAQPVQDTSLKHADIEATTITAIFWTVTWKTIPLTRLIMGLNLALLRSIIYLSAHRSLTPSLQKSNQWGH